MCSPNTTKTSGTSVSDTSFSQQSLTDFLNKMSQTSKTAQAGTSTSTTGPSEEARRLIEQATKPISESQINSYMSPYQQQVIDATMGQLNNQYGQQQQQLKGNAISMGALGGDRAKVAQAVLMQGQGLNTASTIGGLENQGYAQALAAAQAEQNRLLQGAGMMGTTTTGANQMTGTTDTTGESSGVSRGDTSGTSHGVTTQSSRTAQNLGGVGYTTAILGALADGGRVSYADGGEVGHYDTGGVVLPMGWGGPAPMMGWQGPAVGAPAITPAPAPAQPSATEMQGLGKKARVAMNDMMKGMKDPTGKREDAVKNATASPGSGQGGDAGGGSGGGGGGGLMSRMGQWAQSFGGSGTSAAGGEGMGSFGQGLQSFGDSLGQGMEGVGNAIGEGAQAVGSGIGEAAAGAGEGAASIGEGISAGISALAALLAKDGGRIHRADGGGGDWNYTHTNEGLGAGAHSTSFPRKEAAIAAPLGRSPEELAARKEALRELEAQRTAPPEVAPESTFAPLRRWANEPPAPVAQEPQLSSFVGAPAAGGLTTMAKAEPAPVAEPGKMERARAIQDRINTSPDPKLEPFKTAVEPAVTPVAAPVAGGLTPIARPEYMKPEDVKPVQTFRVGLDGNPITEGPGPEPDAAAIAPEGIKSDNPETAGTVSPRGMERSRSYEGFRSTPYWDHGHWAIGYGSAATGKDEGAITEEDALKRHDEDMAKVSDSIKKHVHTKLNQDQFDGLALFTNNLGEGALKEIAGDINKGDFNRAADRMETFNKARNEKTGEKELSPGLLARRHEEASLVRNTTGERTNVGLVAPEREQAAKPPQATGVQGLLQRLGIVKPQSNTPFTPAYPGQEPDKGGILNRLTGGAFNFNPLNLSDRERIALITGGLGGWQAGANTYTAMRGQDISAAQHGQQLAMEAQRLNKEMAAPFVSNQKIGPYGEKFEEYSTYDPKTGKNIVTGGGAGGTSSPYGGTTGDAYNQAIAAVNSGKTGEEFLKSISPMQAGQADRMGSYQEPPADEKTPQGRMQLAMAARAHPGYDPSQYNVIQKTRQDMLSGATAKVMKAGTTGVQHLAEFFEEADKSGTSQFPDVNRIGNYIAEKRGQTGGNSARALAGLGSEETTAFYRGSGGAEGDIERHLSTLNENQSPEQRKAMAGVIARALEGKINSLDLSRDEAFKGAKTKAPPIMTPEAQEDLNAMKLYSRDPNISMAEARRIVKEQAGAGQMIQIGKALIPTPAIKHLLQYPNTADDFDAHYKEPGAAKAALKLYGGKQ